ncbi:cytochrome P450 3A21-like isoform X2 [Ornithodoros turicata]|uniref:cytochrome P450 3A21-like isoform X2 n=1 Tax=Ornithodoros turicata TaxID=34597 RepID=UPI00313A0E7B
MQLPGLFTVPDWVILGVTAAVLLYLYAARHGNYWKNQNVTEEPFALIFGPFLKIFYMTFFAIDQERYQKYGKVFGVYESGKPILFVAEPEIIKKVLVKDFALLPNRRRITFQDSLLDNMMNIAPVERWRKIRPAVSPAFSTGKLKRMTALIEDCARITRKHLQRAAEKNDIIEAKRFFGHFSLDTIARCAFGTNLDSYSDQTNTFVSMARQAFGKDLSLKLILFFLFPGLFKLLKIKPFNSDVFQYFKSLSVNIIKQRQEKDNRNEDFLQLMMDAQEGNLAAPTENTKSRDDELYNLGDDEKTVQFSSDKTVTEDEAMAQCVLFFLAGQDTTSSVISFTIYLLALHPEIQDKLREEVNECFAKHDNRPPFDVISKQKYLNAVISESLRIFPPTVRYVARHRNYWKNQNLTHEPFALIFGPFLKLFYMTFFAIDQERYQKYGKVFGIYEGGKPTLFVADPEIVKKVLVKDFASLPNRRRLTFQDAILDNMMSIAPLERWRKIRPAASPAFSTGKLKRMTALIEDCARITREHLQKAAEKNDNIDAKQFFGHFSLDTIARCAFGTNLDSYSDQTNAFVSKARQAFGQDLNLKFILFFLFPGLFKLLKIKPFNSDAFEYFKSLSVNIIKQRQEKDNRNEDFLQLMMDAQEGNLAAPTENTKSRDDELYNLGDDEKNVQFSSDKTLTEDEALAQCVLFFLGGLDTTSSVISFTLYLLALHPEIQDKLREEVNECFAKHDNRPPFDAISKQKYLNAVISESLRIFPPAVRIERSATEPYKIDGTNIVVPEEGVVAIPVYAMHHDAQYFPEPEKFDPERFSDENLSSIRPYTYLPFGAGPRNCVGMRFALHAVKLCLMNAIHCARFVRTPETQVPLSFYKGFGVLNAKDVTVGVRPLHSLPK